QASEEEAGMLFGLTQDGKVFFHAEQNDTAFIQLRGEPCGGVWGVPIDVDASSRAIWVVCSKEYMTEHGLQLEHFLFAKWGWSTSNNHVWWHMMRGGDVMQLDADDDAMWGLDGHGSILWRPAGDVGKHSRWMRIDGPPNVALKLIAADNDERGTWLWCISDDDRIWRRDPGNYHEKDQHDKWSDRDENGHLYWTKPDGSVLKDLKANMGFALAIDDRGNLLRRHINGTCCIDPASPVHCWCGEKFAPKLSAVTDNGDHGLGFYMNEYNTNVIELENLEKVRFQSIDAKLSNALRKVIDNAGDKSMQVKYDMSMKNQMYGKSGDFIKGRTIRNDLD
ncbi:unnamed protein product, partial [Cladocopium goreaui]